VAFLALSAGMIAMQWFNCGRWFGDVLGDALWLRGID
jgi:hypothetical protein